MELFRNYSPDIVFLKKVREFATKKKIVLIFDECTSGFRSSFGGLYKTYNIKPDILVLGKALGNGYAITAVLGKKEIMNYGQNTFISSTFWTERIGPTAAIATLNEMQRIKSWKIISKKGKFIKSSWKKISENNQVKIKITGLDAIPSFEFERNNLLYKSFITSEFLKCNYLATTTIYLSTAHNQNMINRYLEKLNEIFNLINKFENGSEKITDYFNQKVCNASFTRVN
jgi:glutamate-1-semialdehyde aminotransferase